MHTRRFAITVLVSLASTVALAGDWVGRWVLVEQYYNDGGHNFATGAPALALTFEQGPASAGAGPGVPAGRVEFSGWTVPWPAWFAPDGPAALERREVRVENGRLVGTYRVAPTAGDETTLVVTETCATRDDDRLSCKVAVAFERGGVRAGGFTWTRVFVREGAAR